MLPNPMKPTLPADPELELLLLLLLLLYRG